MKLILLTIIGLFNAARCAQILGVFPFGTSHYMLANTLMKGLAEAGHDVTMISPYEDNEPPKRGSYKNIVLTGFAEDFQRLVKRMNLFETGHDNSITGALRTLKHLLEISDATLNHTNVKKFFASNEKFDVVILDQFVDEALAIFANRFNAPLILFSSVGASSWVNGKVGNPSPPSYIPAIISDFPSKMSFLQRLQNGYMTLADILVTHLYFLPYHNDILKKNFPTPPDIYDLYYNVSLVLLNSHESLGDAVPLVPNMVQIGGFHVKPPKALPKDLQHFLDSAEEGVIYFSMGSNLKSMDLPPPKRAALLKAFGKLKQKVLWKWEDNHLPGQPPNVKIEKWLPQNDILAHPNVKLFITHGGISSIIETVKNGVTVLVIPVFGDQITNAGKAVRNGFALKLPFNDPTFTEEKLSSLLNELLTNPKYRENVKKRSELFQDRPLKPMDNAIYWVEYVIRHKGAPHLRVAGLDLPWYQYLLLDVIAVVVASSLLISWLIYLGIRKVVRKITRRGKLKTN